MTTSWRRARTRRCIRQIAGHARVAVRAGDLLELPEHRLRRVERGGRRGDRQALSRRRSRDLLFGPIGMTSASVTRAGLESARSWARPHSVGRRPLEVSDAYYRVPGGGRGQQQHQGHGAVDDRADGRDARGARPEAARRRSTRRWSRRPGERRRLRKFLERLDEPHYGYGWRSYDYAGHRIVGHRGGVNGYRSLILFDPARKSGVVAMWNSNTSQPGGLEFEVMDMLYELAVPRLDGARQERPPATVAEPPRKRRTAAGIRAADGNAVGVGR